MAHSERAGNGTFGGKLHIAAPDQQDWVFEIDRPIVRIGRAEADTDLVLPHGWVSRAHARLYADRLPYRIEDVGSSNGTMVNANPLPQGKLLPLQDGDVIAIGPFRLTLEAPPEAVEEEEQPATEKPGEAPDEEREGQGLAGVGMRARPRGRPAPPMPPPPPEEPTQIERQPTRWVGMPERASRWLQYLPPIYAEPGSSGDEFLGRFLLVFEDLLGPIEQLVGHFGLYLDPNTAPATFLPVLDEWLGGLVEERWSDETKRELLKQAYWLYRARGTRAGLTRYLEICTGITPEIEENADGPHHFRVTLHTGGRSVDPKMIERIIERNRPAHTSYRLVID
jgi:phage tail-like protein